MPVPDCECLYSAHDVYCTLSHHHSAPSLVLIMATRTFAVDALFEQRTILTRRAEPP